jgi:uncharacterized protein (TIGR02246 family)
MKNYFLSVFVVVIVLASCQPKSTTVPFDPVAAKEGLTKMADSTYQAYNAKDVKTFLSFLAEDGLYCGTDSKEFWDKQTYSKLMTEMFADTTSFPKIIVDKREIRFDNNGNTAIVVDQFFASFSKRIPVRHVYHLVKTGNRWVMDFSSVALIPDNEDVAKILKTLK